MSLFFCSWVSHHESRDYSDTEDTQIVQLWEFVREPFKVDLQPQTTWPTAEYSPSQLTTNLWDSLDQNASIKLSVIPEQSIVVVLIQQASADYLFIYLFHSGKQINTDCVNSYWGAIIKKKLKQKVKNKV